MNYQYAQYLKSPYHGHACPTYVVVSDSLQPAGPEQGHALLGLDTGASLTGLVEDLTRSPFSSRLPGEDDPVEGLLIEKEQMLRARVKHLADELAQRYRLRDSAIWTMDYEQCKLQTEIWDLERLETVDPQARGIMSRLASEKLRLEKDKADQVQTAWKDALGIKGELLDAIRDLRKLQGQHELLAEPDADDISILNARYGEGLTY